MLFAALLATAVYGNDQCVGLDNYMCMATQGCFYDDVTGCSGECKDLGIPPPFNTFIPHCSMICTDPMLMLAASMFCTKSCGLCPEVPTAPPTEPPTEEPTAEGFVKSYDACTRQEIQNEMEAAIYDIINSSGSTTAVAPCLAMRTHLAEILDSDDQLVGTPDALLICGCLEHFDETFAEEHLNCVIADEHIYDLSFSCKEDIGTYRTNVCDPNAIEAEIQASMSPEQEIMCAGFASGLEAYGTDAFDPTTICDCVYSLGNVFAAKTLNCMMGGEHAMQLYTDICPAYENPCSREIIKEAMIDEIVSSGRVNELTIPCLAMSDHFNVVLDPETDLVKAGEYGDFALICQCLGQFPRHFVDDHLRCGLAGHDAYTIWNQCSQHTPRCEDMDCTTCESRLRCSMSTDGTCKTSCPNDGTCLDDPSVDYTCADLENMGVI